ncbi:D-aminopeptidase [Halalkalibacter akibai JCM 9157]|uniref:D-aminopeptidase n=1 Tax=Halalkalibacter akibai (strain ATCC 43226 / DSM 21942 / CIP 109018 / JCM 9157 / 1139) TaxID=1236973 RepID=W4QZP6_HALA3|nr:D-aminopeptidase [Halalkalibacter akibai JCM 9157]
MIVDGHHYTLGALVVSNFGTKDDLPSRFNNSIAIEEELEDMPDGSIMIVLATDAPLSERQLHRLAKRASFGLARTGSYAAHGSGDIVIAFSTAHKISHYPTGITNSFSFIVEDGPLISNFFQMAVEVVEESIWNSLCTATTTIGQNQHIRYEFDYNFFR